MTAATMPGRQAPGRIASRPATMPCRRWHWLPALLLAVLALPAQAGNGICRVTQDGNDSSDGSNWAQAMSLTAALAAPACTELWVAEGLYLPSSDGDPLASFTLRPGTAVFGGFAGNETAREQRDLASRHSVLSGDLDGDDTTDAHGVTLSGMDIAGENSQHVVRLDGGHDRDTVLDGLIITGGMAINADQDFLGGIGAGINCYGQGPDEACRPTLRNLLIRGNFAFLGGGMACLAIDGGVCEPVLEAITFADNLGQMGAGLLVGVVASGGNPVQALLQQRPGNVAGTAVGQALAVVENSTFTGNTALADGAAVFAGGVEGEDPVEMLILRNVTLTGNAMLAESGAALASFEAGISLHNSIAWGNLPASFRAQEPDLILGHSLVQGGCPVLADCTGLVQGDPLLGPLQAVAATAQLRIPDVASPAIDSGDCASAAAHDQRGVDRPRGTGCDLGAVELRQVAVQVQVSGGGHVSALPTTLPLSGLIDNCSHDSGDCLAWYATENHAPALTLRLWPEPGLLASASGCGGKLAGNYFSTAPLDGDCTITVTFAARQWPVGGTVTGQLGSGLTLQLNDDELLPLAGDGPFQFDTLLAAGAPYAVGIGQQPVQPDQTCQVINGSGTVGDGPVDNVVIHCGAAQVHTVGGTVSGLAQGGTLALQLNGGQAQELAANGPFVFPDLFHFGDGYLVTVAEHPAGQHCSVSAGEGVIGNADVDDVQVHCSAGGAQLQIQLEDDGDYAAYGSVRDYRVLLANSGNGPVQDVQVTASFDPALDGAAVTWECLTSAPGTACTASGSGGFDASASLAPGTSVVWRLRVPVRMDSDAPQATVQVQADGAGSASDSNTLVIFRDGLDVPYGAHSAPPPAPAGAAMPGGTRALAARPGASPSPAPATGAAPTLAAAATPARPPAAAGGAALAGTVATPVPASRPAGLALLLLAVFLVARRRLASAT